MRTYGQFCPIARASEILSERWVLIIIRNLLLGCRSFNEIAGGTPGLSRGLLSKRLHELARVGVIEIRPKPDGRGSLYELTQAGRDLWPVIQAMRGWGTRWLELSPADAAPDVVLWMWSTAYLRREMLPERRVLVRFDFPDQPAARRRLWFLAERGEAEICHKHPGFDEDLVVVVEDPRTFARWHLGQLEWGEALRLGHIRVAGPPMLARALPTWNGRAKNGGHATDGKPADRRWSPPRATRRAGIPGFGGPVVTPADAGYDAARRVWNGAVDRRPAYVAYCREVADVVAAVRFARERDLAVTVRGGGHGVAGTAVCDDGLVIDLSPMKRIGVDPASRTAQVGTGTLWGELDAATQAFGLATTGGIVSHTGVSGLTLGGGIGWLMRRHGLTVDNLLSADVVTADGSVFAASEDEHPDLFWALRGGGGGHSVVTSFTYRLHPVGPTVLAGPVLWPLEDGGEVLRRYRDFVADAPREVATLVTLRKAPALPVLPIELHGRPVCAITLCYLGDPSAGERALAPLRGFRRPLIDLVGPRPYTGLQSLVDATVPHGWHYYWKSTNLGPLSEPVIDTLVDQSSRIGSPLSYSVLFHLGGAVADVDENATAYSHRDVVHALNINGVWLPGQPAGQQEMAWTRDFFAAVGPQQTGVYVNFLDGDDAGRLPSAYGNETYRRLTAVKNRYDPANVFRAGGTSSSPAAAPAQTPCR